MDIFTWIAAISVGVVIGFTLGVGHLIAKWRKTAYRDFDDENDPTVVLGELRHAAGLMKEELKPEFGLWSGLWSREVLNDFRRKVSDSAMYRPPKMTQKLLDEVEYQLDQLSRRETAEAECRAAALG